MSKGKFLERTHAPGGLFHVTSHAVPRTKLFGADSDMGEYLAKLANYLSPESRRDSSRHKYEKLFSEVAVLAYCLLENHIHLIVRDKTGYGMSRLMHRVQAGYALYFNKKYGRRGPLYDAPFAAKPILDEDHARFAIGYVHLNHVTAQLDYRFCSHPVFMGSAPSDWLDVDDARSLFGGIDGYRRFINRTGPAILRRKSEEKGFPPNRNPFRPMP